ncbi:hypothetical protein B0T09DRAFT_340453 [Sordaria sp. MPI-SDFR-AT-0083]|nr:hypothetical protein B0T09DRAFT_340453 [Sordaria sp. MPI-SDFR-AT-0083]
MRQCLQHLGATFFLNTWLRACPRQCGFRVKTRDVLDNCGHGFGQSMPSDPVLRKLHRRSGALVLNGAFPGELGVGNWVPEQNKEGTCRSNCSSKCWGIWSLGRKVRTAERGKESRKSRKSRKSSDEDGRPPGT